MGRKIVFIFGAGASLASGMPTSSAILTQMLSGEGVIRHSAGVFYFGAPVPGQADDYVSSIVEFLRILKSEVDDYYKALGDRTATYEDLYYLASQIHDSESGEYDNPALGPLISKTARLVEAFPQKPPFGIRVPWSIIDLANETTNYVRDTVSRMLSRRIDRTAQYDLIKDCMLAGDFDPPAVFTLNHDTVLESNFAHHGIVVQDGFGPVTDLLRPWTPEVFASRVYRDPTLCKLHGSINWFKFEYLPPPFLASTSKETWNQRNSKGEEHRAIDDRPEMLLGTFNKILDYSHSVYAVMQEHFSRSLNQSNLLVVSGLSFNDKAINTRIIDWLTQAKERVMVVVHPNCHEMKMHARPAIAKHIDEWKRTGRLVCVEKGLEHTSWAEVRQLL